MNRLLSTVLFSILLLTNSICKTDAQTQLFRAGKSLDIQYSILRELSMHYVDTVDVGKLVENNINYMLSALDPYTEYLPEEFTEDMEIMATGSYGGVGSVIKKIETGEVLVSQPYEGSPSAKVGLKPGDLILAVDGVSTKDLDVSECSNRMKGEPGTELKLLIRQARTGDTTEFTLIRERIPVRDVGYWGYIADTVGYVGVSGFSQDCTKDLLKGIEEMKQSGNLKRLVLDLRGNGGGLMEEAIKMVSLFVPKGTLVVSSKGRIESINEEYYTTTDPVLPDIPLMVLVNSGSASSAEIVAGALQDLDRAVIAGTRTFGKGLIQVPRDVGYGAQLKITIAKYYTPSGRCVQAIDYSNRNEDGSVGFIPDSLIREFKTKNNRSVYDGGGITPDLIVEADYLSRPTVALYYSDIMNDYAIQYFTNNLKADKPESFRLSDAEYSEFVEYAITKDFDSRTVTQIEMERMISSAKRDGTYDEFKNEFDMLSQRIVMDKKSFLESKEQEIRSMLEQSIMEKYYYQWGSLQYSLRDDSQLKKALKRWDEVSLMPKEM